MSDATADDAAMSHLELVKELFAEDGMLVDVGELGWMLRKVGMDLSHEQLHEALGVLDIDESGTISIANFTEWWKTNGAGTCAEIEDAEETRARGTYTRDVPTRACCRGCLLKDCLRLQRSRRSRRLTSTTAGRSTPASSGCSLRRSGLS